MGILAAIFAEILLLPLETKIVDNIVELWYLGEYGIRVPKDAYRGIFGIVFVILLGLLYYGSKRIYGIPSKVSQVFHHGTEHKRIIAEILNEGDK